MRTPSETREHLNDHAALRQCFDRIIVLLQSRSDISVAVSGSLASRTIDRYSDLDLEVIVHPGTKPDDVVTWLRHEVPGTGRLLAAFPATHLGLDRLLIFFFIEGNAIAKADIWVMDVDSFARIGGAHLIVDPHGVVEAELARKPVDEPPPSPDFEDLFHKFVGWIWYTTSKIGRGERFEAYDSLHVIRTRVLVPCIQVLESLPFEGFRRVEARFSEQRMAALRRTCAADTSVAELRRSLDEMITLFEELHPRVTEHLGLDPARSPLLDPMKDMVRREAHGA